MSSLQSVFAAPFRLAFGLSLFLLAACSPSADLASSRSFDFPTPLTQPITQATTPLPPAEGEIIGNGPIRVALILPLSGQGSSANVGRTMANGARLAMDFMARSGASRIHLVIKDAGAEETRAKALAQQAVTEGARLILGPLRASAVAAAGEVALAANVPLIGFSNTAAVARPGVYLLSVLPEAEAMRALTFARAQGRRNAVALVPANAYGEMMGDAFQRAASDLGMPVRGVLRFADEAQARQRIEQIVPQLLAGQIDIVFLPDSATAPSFGMLLGAAEVARDRITILGSSDWVGKSAIANEPYLAGALYPAIDPTGLAALAAVYRTRFGGEPHQLASVAYSAIVLANAPALTATQPPYSPQALLTPSGFTGRDGVFRFHHDGRGEYGLVMMRVGANGAEIADPARLGGLTRENAARSTGGNVIPPVGASLIQR